MLQKLARWLVDLDYGQIPPEALRAARYQYLNMLAASYAAARLPETTAVDKAARAFSGAGRSTVIASGRKTDPCVAAAVNAAYSMAQDFDDIIWMGHTCHSSVFASLAVAEHEGASTRQLLEAIVISNEVAGRLAAASFLGPLNGQMTTFIHLIGAAAATAKLLKLDATRTAHALAISLAQPNFALQPAFMAPTSKLLSASVPIQTGIQAAYFAREGMTGALELLEDSRGFFSRFSFLPLPHMFDDLGSFWAITTLTMKDYPGCHYFQTACSAIEELRARRPFASPDELERVVIETTKLAREVTRFGADYAPATGPITAVGANFDLATTAAILLQAGRLTGCEVTPEWLERNTPALRALHARIEVRHEPALTAKTLSSAASLPSGRKALAALKPANLLKLRRRYAAEYRSELMSAKELVKWLELGAKRLVKKRAPASAAAGLVPLYFPSRVTLVFRDGTRESAQVDLPAGALCAPGVEQMLAAKFATEATPVLGAERAARAFKAGLTLDSLSLSELIAATLVSP